LAARSARLHPSRERLGSCLTGRLATPVCPAFPGHNTATHAHTPCPIGALNAPPRVPPSVKRAVCGAGILTSCPSPTRLRLGLGPTNPEWIILPQEPLGLRWPGFSPGLSLLIPAFALLCAPAVLPVDLLCLTGRSPTIASSSLRKRRPSAASVLCLSPGELAAPLHSTSELLRTLSRVAASEPTSWLSEQSDLLAH